MAGTYFEGTVDVAVGETTVILTGGLAIPINMKVGDAIAIGGLGFNAIAALTPDPLVFELAQPHDGVGGPGQSYIVYHMPYGWGDTVSLAEQTAQLIRDIVRGQNFEWVIALSNPQGTFGAAPSVVTFPVPQDVTVTGVSAFAGTPSTSGPVVVDINLDGLSILSPKLTIDATEQSSVTAAVPAVLGQPGWTKGQVLTVDIDNAGSNAGALSLTILGRRPG